MTNSAPSLSSFDSDTAGSSLPDLICFSHLRWSFIWQRPQHLLTRIARGRRVFVVEEPIESSSAEAPHLASERWGDVVVLTPHLPSGESFRPGFNETSNATIKLLLSTYFRDMYLTERCVLWYYSPMALGAEPTQLAPATTVVYDAMDELSNFLGAPRDLAARELELIGRADIVFTGGPSLFEKRRSLKQNTYCFPSGVERDHFGQRFSAVPEDIRSISKPIIGFFGVLDERIDFDLIAAMADQRPGWSITLIGPFAKVDEQAAPRRENIHYLGRKAYAELPAYLQQFDVAILPFALNEATRFISPTKTLEYLAGGKSVVSTQIRDVVDLYGSVVTIADGAAQFVAAIDGLLTCPNAESQRSDHWRKVDLLLRAHSWDEIARQMHSILLDFERRADKPALAPIPYSRAFSIPKSSAVQTAELAGRQ